MLLQGFLIGFTLLIHGFGGGAHAESGTTISEHVGKTVELPCPMNMTVCGALHSINWFKGETRIAAVLLDDSNITSVSEGYKDRVIVEQSPFKLIIKDLQISDEDIYLCDTTFFIPLEACDNYYGYRVKLNVLVPPTEVVIVDEKGDRIENGTVLGPLQEGHTLRSTCIVKNTRPQPSVGWFRANKRLTTHSPTYDEKDGLYTATLELSLVLTRQDLGNTIECRVESSAIQGTIRSVIDVDMQVRPTGITLSGVEHHTVQGSKVVLTCQVYGARPAVNISWSNSSVPIVDEDNALTEIRTHAVEQNDGTFHTVSDLIFNASRFENDMVFRCDADNVVLQMNREKPIYSFVTLEVMYPPVVKVSPPHITVNTSDTVLLNCEYVANPATLTSVKWYRNTDLVNVNDTDRYEGGNSENVALVIKSTDKRDIGNYSCHLSNSITSGKGVSETQIELDVQYVPIVEVLMTPEGPVKESDESNVTLYCNIVDANPSQLTKVRWYANSSLLKELPDCTETNEDLCHIDPSKLLLESIGRGFFYNYSCEGFNAAGWGPRSDDKELMVHYEPGPATLTHFPLIAVKKKSVTFSCSVDDPGYPESNRFRWFRGGRGPLQDVVTKDWTVEPVGLDSRTNYSCYAYNEGGHGVPATVNLEVHAPPFFIKNLFPYTGIVFSSRNASLMCRIECVPRCTISWYKDGIALGPDNERYFVKEEYMAASPATGDFESVMSVLHFNMTAWPNKRFDIDVDSANYSCVSSNNAVGPGIKSATYFSIEYAPENTTVTDEVVHVLESNIPGRVVCKSKANPEPSYEWRFNNKTITRGSTLIINNPMSRNDTGRYTCVAFNKHGSSVSDTFIDVQFKPKCEIERREIDDKDTLICTAFGNPVEADFSWSIKAENDSVETLGNGKINKDKSFYILDEDYAIARTYRCVANNSVGAGTFCEIEVAEQLAWWQRWDKTTLIILVAAVLALLLAVIIICCIIICICRRRRRQDKYHTEVSISATQSVLSYQPTSPLPSSTTSQTPLEIPKSPPRWPLRPGVMVHVKNDTKQNLAANRLVLNTSNTSGASTIPRSYHLSGTTKATVESKPNTNINNNNTCTSLSSTINNIIRTKSTLSMNNCPSSPPTSSLATLQSHNNNNTSLGARSNHSILRGGTQSLGRPSSKLPKTVRVNPNNTILTDELPTPLRRPVPPPLPPRNPRLLKNSINSSNLLTNISATSANELLPKSNETNCHQQATTSPSDDEESPIQITNNSNTETSRIIRESGFFDRFVTLALGGDLFKRRKNDDDRTRDSQRSHVGLLSSMLNAPKAFWRQKDDSNPFSTEHRLKGIRCSGSVTYKKTPTLTRSTGASEAVSTTDADVVATITSAVSNSAQPKTPNEIHDKSSSLGDPLTEPGEYENLPFHGLQTAPNKDAIYCLPIRLTRSSSGRHGTVKLPIRRNADGRPNDPVSQTLPMFTSLNR
ncbi:hemicentin-1 isoform X5 [Episyrphus balteatus]|uniref:hemicentin-1 isoform X5 n=1 Tax=Episyrphus balteatus TaxID=286459 RepID=UPI0024853830|nr:hemicentin-1 isoform X5 [Episyrphus balteatus]